MTLDITFAQLPACLPVAFAGDAEISVAFGEVITAPEADWYVGDYAVTPSDTGTILPTAQKRMEQDVTVHPIPYFCVSNPSGGDTVYIGGEIDMT